MLFGRYSTSSTIMPELFKLPHRRVSPQDKHRCVCMDVWKPDITDWQLRVRRMNDCRSLADVVKLLDSSQAVSSARRHSHSSGELMTKMANHPYRRD